MAFGKWGCELGSGMSSERKGELGCKGSMRGFYAIFTYQLVSIADKGWVIRARWKPSHRMVALCGHTGRDESQLGVRETSQGGR